MAETKSKVAVVSIKVGDLRDALTKGMLVDQRTRDAVYQCSRLDVVGGKGTLTTQDSDKAVRVSFDAMGPDISCLIPRRLALKFLSGGDGQVTLQSHEKSVVLTREGLGKMSLTASGLISDFTVPQVPSDLKWAKFDAKWFLKMLRAVIVCAATDESRPVITGIMCEDGRMASVDGFRLAVVKDDRLTFGLGTRLTSINNEMEEVRNQVLLPRLIAIAGIKAFTKEESVEFAVGKLAGNANDVIFLRGGGTLIHGQGVMGNYPAIDQLIPNSFESRATFSVPLMLQRLNMMDVRGGSGIVRFKFHKTEKGEDIGDIGSNCEGEFGYELELPVKLENEVESKIAFNWKYVLDAIKLFSVCTLDLTSPSSPGKLTGDIKELTIVVMPMFVTW